jgi:hypothetical protein
MEGCSCEQRTHHHRGRWHGFGPVDNTETVVFAVFERSKLDGNLITSDTFDNSDLHRANHSLARPKYCTSAEFSSRVISPGVARNGALVGLARAQVSAIRTLVVADTTDRDIQKRAACVLDRVDDGDIEGHAVLAYGEWTNRLGQKKKSIVRAQIRLQLAEVFGEIIAVQDIPWSSVLGKGLRRCVSLWRATKETLAALGPG